MIKKFHTIVIDPPWQERGGGRIKRGADKHYQVLSVPNIIRIIHQCPHWNSINENAHLYLWATNSFLPQGLKVMEALGFRYITNVCWTKNSIGLGQYFRGKHELCLFGVRGKGVSIRTDDKTIASVINAKKTIHSKKPDAFYTMVEKRSHGPYLDMFSRQHRNKWVVWGDDIDNKKR